MSATMDRSSAGATVDLREPEFSIPAPVVVVDETPPDHRGALRRRRRVVVAVVVGVVVALGLQFLVGTLMAAQRQRHLAYEFTVPDAKIGPGDATMVLQAPSIGLNVVVAEGASSQELRGGPGRVIGTTELGTAGNVVVLGRSTRFGAAFARLGELAKGDQVVAKSRAGVVRSYTVESVRSVAASSAAPLRSDDDRLTLVTSGSGLLPSTRRVVVARAVAPPVVAVGAAGATARTDGAASSSPPPVLGVDALDERSTSALGVVLAVLLLAGASFGGALAVRRLRRSYRVVTVIQIAIPMAVMLLIVMFIIGDSLLPTTY